MISISLKTDISTVLEIKASSDKKSSSIDMNLFNGSKILVGFTVTGNTAKAENITIPSSKDTVDVENIDEWMESVDFDNFISALKKTSLPKDLIEMLEQGLKQVA